MKNNYFPTLSTTSYTMETKNKYEIVDVFKVRIFSIRRKKS